MMTVKSPPDDEWNSNGMIVYLHIYGDVIFYAHKLWRPLVLVDSLYQEPNALALQSQWTRKGLLIWLNALVIVVKQVIGSCASSARVPNERMIFLAVGDIIFYPIRRIVVHMCCCYLLQLARNRRIARGKWEPSIVHRLCALYS